jgi:hypothetical protein
MNMMPDTKVEMPADLRTLTEKILSHARRELENTGGFDPVFAMRLPDGQIDHPQLPPGFGRLMNSGEAKKIIFGALRQTAEARHATAVVIATDSWMGVPNAGYMRRFGEHPKKEDIEAALRGKSIDALVKEGVMDKMEAITITIHTPKEVFIVTQFYERDKRRATWTRRNEICSAQEDFQGRQKIFGDAARGEL